MCHASSRLVLLVVLCVISTEFSHVSASQGADSSAVPATIKQVGADLHLTTMSEGKVFINGLDVYKSITDLFGLVCNLTSALQEQSADMAAMNATLMSLNSSFQASQATIFGVQLNFYFNKTNRCRSSATSPRYRPR